MDAATRNQVSNAIPLVGNDTLTLNQIEGLFRVIDRAATKAFPVLTGGLQLRFGRLGVYSHYQYMPEGRDFLLTGSQHVFQAGLRYALTGAREEVTTRR